MTAALSVCRDEQNGSVGHMFLRMAYRSSLNPSKKGWRTFSLGGLRTIFNFSQQFWLNPDAAMRDPSGVGLGLLAASAAGEDRWPMPYRSRIARVDQVVAVPLFAVECEAGDRQRLTLGAGFLHPIVTAARRVGAVADL
jgi:hypothetical protein